MPELVSVNVRIRADDLEQIKAWAADRDWFYAELIRKYVHDGVLRERSNPSGPTLSPKVK